MAHCFGCKGGVGAWGFVPSLGAIRPAARTGATTVFSQSQGRVVLFGGYVAGAADNAIYILDYGRGTRFYKKESP